MGRFYCVFPLSFFYRPPDDIGFTLLSGRPDDRINTSTFGRKFYCHISEWKNVVNQKFTTYGTVTNTCGTMYEIMNRPDGDFSKRLFPPYRWPPPQAFRRRLRHGKNPWSFRSTEPLLVRRTRAKSRERATLATVGVPGGERRAAAAAAAAMEKEKYK